VWQIYLIKGLWQSTLMSEPTDLRFTGRSADGSELELVDQNGSQYSLRISDTLRSAINQPRLSAVADVDEVISTTVKEVQARLRSGESIDSISRTTDWSIEKVENYAGPILQERAFIISQALATQIKREPHAPYLETAVSNQLAPRGVDMNTVEWNTHRLPDGNWELTLYYPLRDGSPSEAKLVSIKEDVAPYSPTPLVAVDEIDEEAKSDGVTRRIKIPSWDDIMFGKKDED